MRVWLFFSSDSFIPFPELVTTNAEGKPGVRFVLGVRGYVFCWGFFFPLGLSFGLRQNSTGRCFLPSRSKPHLKDVSFNRISERTAGPSEGSASMFKRRVPRPWLRAGLVERWCCYLLIPLRYCPGPYKRRLSPSATPKTQASVGRKEK